MVPRATQNRIILLETRALSKKVTLKASLDLLGRYGIEVAHERDQTLQRTGIKGIMRCHRERRTQGF